jgi:predicted ArsR family transcriptional regulator
MPPDESASMNPPGPARRDGDALIAALDDPTRRILYRYVANSDHAVGREEAAAAVGAARGTVAFHLDRLVDAGLLTVIYRRLNARAGPGAGRPSKLYRASSDTVEFSIPPRQYLLAGKILTAALDSIHPATAAAAVHQAALEQGRRAVAAAVAGDSLPPGLQVALTSLGYEPETETSGDIRLRNCPFHTLANHSVERTCAMNHAFLEGVLDGLGDHDHRAELSPSPGHCCVRLNRGAPDRQIA